MHYIDKNRIKNSVPARLIVLVLIGVLLVLGLTFYFFVGSTPTKATSGVIKTSTSTTKTSSSTTPTESPKDTAPSTTTPQDSTKPAAGATSPDTVVVPPSGTFVSNHKPNLDGSPAPSKEQSSCNTTPGASCSIQFTNTDGVVKTLPAKIADNNGSVIWDWDVKDAGFTQGEWLIKAIVTLNGDTKTTTDSLKLEVQP